MESRDNLAMFLRCSQPHPSVEACDAELRAFWDDVANARAKHRIANLYLVAAVNRLNENGDPEEGVSMGGFGDQTKFLTLIARAYGKEEELMRNLLISMRSGKGLKQ